MARARTLVLNTRVNVTGEDQLRGLGRTLQRTGSLLTAGVTLPLIGFGASMLSAARDAAEAEAKLTSVFDSMGASAFTSIDALNEHAEALQAATTFDDEAITELQAVLLTFGRVTGDSFDRATAAALDMSALFDGDLQAAALQLGKALNDPIQGLGALRRVGVSFTEQQIEQIKVMQQSGDLLGAQNIILGELERQFGNTAEALAATDFGQMTQALNELGDASEEFGEILAPVLRDVAGGAKEFARWLRDLNPETREAIVRFGLLAAALGPLLIVFGSLLRVLSPFGRLLTPLATKLGTLSTALGTSRLALLGWIGVIGAAGVAVGQQYGDVLEGLSGQILTDFARQHGIAADQVTRDVARISEALGVDIPEAQKRLLAGMDGNAEAYTRTVRGLVGVTEEASAAWDGLWAPLSESVNDTMNGPDGVVPTVAVAAAAMAAEMAAAPGEMADALLANQFELTGPDGAIDELVAFMDQALSPAEEKFNARAFLASQAYADGMASGTPSVVKKTEELAEEAHRVLASGDASAGGASLIDTWINGMDSAWARGINRVYAITTQTGRLLGTSLPTEGPLAGGVASGGRSIIESWFSDMDKAARRGMGTLTGIAAAAGASLNVAASGLAALPSPSVAGGVGATVVNNFYLRWDGEPPKGRNEEEIIANLQRLIPLAGGKLAPGY